jgi:ADP-heptose:LPS heptosyltransferase
VVAFLGSGYTRPILERCKFIDEIYDWPVIRDKGGDLSFIEADIIFHVFPQRPVARAAKESKIPIRVGTSHRIYHLFTCNRLVNLGRKHILLNEAQLNLRLLRYLKIRRHFYLEELPKYSGWKLKDKISDKITENLHPDKFNLILHLKSQGNALEWPPEKFLALAKLLKEDQYRIFISGTNKEGEEIRNEVPELLSLPHVVNITDKFTLEEFIDFVQVIDGLVSSSTGPLHIAAINGLRCLGLYPDMRPKDATRWGPIGEKAEWIEDRGSDLEQKYLTDIEPQEVYKKIENWRIENERNK